MFATGDIVHFWSDRAQKHKWHLCVNFDGCFLFLCSPKKRSYPGDFEVGCADIPGVPPTASGKSIISCNIVLRFTEQELRDFGARKVGRMSAACLTDLLQFIEESTLLPADDKNAILDGLGDYC